jgi:hypothetical protein
MTTRRFTALSATGVAAGLLAGLFGVGGGVVMVPLLMALLLMPQRTASSTSLFAIVPIAGAAAWGYAANGNVDYRSGALLLLGGIVGGQLGGWLLPRVRVATLQFGFGLLSIATAVRLFWPVADEAIIPVGAFVGDVLLVVVGLCSGILAALFGIGGGIILVPAMVLLTGANADAARGTSLIVVIGTAVTASVRLVRAGYVDVRAGLTAGLVGAPAGLVGSALGQWLPQQVALWLFAALLVYSGLRVMRSSRQPGR